MILSIALTGWLVFFIVPATGALYVYFSKKKRELDAVEETAKKAPKSAWVETAWKNPTNAEINKAKKFMEKKGKVPPFKLKEHKDGTFSRED